jgi:4'-phosphopantetheinyl transferase EntD
LSFFEALVQKANQLNPGAILHFAESPAWGSASPDYRFSLRKHLAQYLEQNHMTEVNATALNLKTLPQFDSLFVSISHCPDVGAYVVSRLPVGIDIETTHRVRPEIVERICKKKELQLVSDPCLLWSAKEALFKRHRILKLISDTHIEDWTTSQNEIHVFKDFTSQGWVRHFDGHYSALVIKKD